MSIIKLAWDNLWYNKTRTILNIILIAVAFSSLMFISGYNNYAREGIMIGVTEANGSIVIADKSYWDINSEKVNMLNNNDVKAIYKKLDTYKNVSGHQKKIDISGLIGTGNKSKFFAGFAYEDVSRILKGLSLKEGTPVFNDDTDTALLGIDLAEYLNVSYDKDTYLNVMANFGDGISLGSFIAVGALSFNNSFANVSSVIFPLTAIYNIFNIENGSAHSLIIYLKDYNEATEMKNNLNKYFISNNLSYEVKDWKDLNEFMLTIIDMNSTNYFIVLIILSILVFASIMQTLTTNFLERLREFGTLRAIGINIKNITLLLFLEIVLLVILSTIISIVFSYISASILNSLEIIIRPPGVTDGFPFSIILKIKDSIFIFAWILIISLLAAVYPVYKVIKLKIIEVIKYV